MIILCIVHTYLQNVVPTRMDPDVQRNVDTVLTENSVTMSTGLVSKGVRRGIITPGVKSVNTTT